MSIADFLEPAVKDFADQATATYSAPIDTTKFTGRQFVAGEDPLQTQAIRNCTTRCWFLSTIFNSCTSSTTLKQQELLVDLGGLTGASAYQPFMSPYQQQVIDTTLTEFDRSRVRGQTKYSRCSCRNR